MFWIPVTDLEAVYIHTDIHIDILSAIKYYSQHGGLPKTRFSQTARSAISSGWNGVLEQTAIWHKDAQ